MYDVLKFLPMVELSDEDAFKASHGVFFPDTISESRDIVLMVDSHHTVIAIYKYVDGQFKCQRGLNEAWK